MAEGERTLLLPNHQSEATRDQPKRWRRRAPDMQHYYWWGLASVAIAFAVVATSTHRWTAGFQRTPPTSDDDDENNSGEGASERTGMTMAKTDFHADRWGEWKRQAAPEAGTSLFHQHLELAQQIIDWETLKADLGQFWEETEPKIEETTKQALTKTSELWHYVEAALQRDAQIVEQEAQKEWQTFMNSASAAIAEGVQNTQSALNSTLVGVENEHWWQNMSDWFKDTWTTYSHEAHDLWVELSEKAKVKEHEWWNKTVETERVWYANSITAIHRMSTNMRQWWINTSAEVVHDERVIQERFAHWWNETAVKERLWWKRTRESFHDFVHEAEHKERLWWHMLQHASQTAWNDTKITTNRAWKNVKGATQHAWDVSTHEIDSDARRVWNATVTTEQRMWNAVQKWFRAHATYTEELSQPILYLNTTATFGMLMNGYGWYDYSKDFFLLQGGWDAQINQAYCAVASCAALLNSLQGLVETLPVDDMYSPYPYATQLGLLQGNTTCVNSHVVRYNDTFDGVFHAPGGLSLEGAKNLLECYLPLEEYEVVVHRLDPDALDLDELRMNLTKALTNPLSRVMINYDRKVLGQVGAGHFSPLGSYYETEDRFLIMDVAKYKYPAVWVPAARLFASMATIDACGESNLLPAAQDALPALSDFANQSVYLKQLSLLGCKPTYRGYIVVRPRRGLAKTSLQKKATSLQKEEEEIREAATTATATTPQQKTP